MANDNQDSHSRLEKVALEIFSASMATGVNNYQMAQAVERAFRGAAEFLKVSNEIKAGRPVVKEDKKGPKFADCSAPCLPKNHPLNLIAVSHKRRDGSECGGDVALVSKIFNRIKDINCDNLGDEYVLELSEFGILWDRAVIKTAQQVFPPVLEHADKN